MGCLPILPEFTGKRGFLPDCLVMHRKSAPPAPPYGTEEPFFATLPEFQVALKMDLDLSLQAVYSQLASPQIISQDWRANSSNHPTFQDDTVTLRDGHVIFRPHYPKHPTTEPWVQVARPILSKERQLRGTARATREPHHQWCGRGVPRRSFFLCLTVWTQCFPRKKDEKRWTKNNLNQPEGSPWIRRDAPWPQTTRRNIWWWGSLRCSQLFDWRLGPQAWSAGATTNRKWMLEKLEKTRREGVQ